MQRNFLNPIMRYFRMNCKTVVLAFDDYKFVPASKSITQANRSKGKAPFQFNERQHLETVMPENYNDRLSNRVYKRRVIDLIVESVPDILRLGEGQRLVIDYVDCPVKFELDKTTKKVRHDYMTEIPPMGECDVKFTRWSRMLGDLIAHSVDGDFIPIALMEHERMVNEGRNPASIAIFRIEYNMGSDEPTKGKKRDRGGVVKKKKTRQMEYLNIPLLFQVMHDAMLQCGGRNVDTPHARCLMRILASLIAITGTDFTR